MYFEWLPILVFPIVLAGTFYGTYGFVTALIFILIIVIWILVKVDVDKNVLLFKDDNITYLKNPQSNVVTYTYSDIQTLHISKPLRGESQTILTFSGRLKFYIDVDKPGGLDANRDDLFAFLWEKNPAIIITASEGLFRYKYFLLRGEVRKVEY